MPRKWTVDHPEAELRPLESIKVGLTAEFEREISETDILEFAHNSGDYNPLHIDAEYAAGSNFQGRIAHGVFQVGLASQLAGMRLPGRNVLLGGVNARFLAPLFYPARVAVRGKIVAWNATERSGRLRVVVVDLSSAAPVSDIYLTFTYHDSCEVRSEQLSAPTRQAESADLTGARSILVTGASGGIGCELVAALASEYRVLAVSNRHSLPQEIESLESVNQVHCDLNTDHLDDALAPYLDASGLYAVIHAAWPGVPHGGLLQAEDDVIERQLDFGALQTIRLARFLFRYAESGGRFVAIGSIYGEKKPNVNLAAYSLGKSALESTVCLLAPELARKKITINTVCPSQIAVGMNKAMDERQSRLEVARIPMGRLCETADLLAAVRYLLSDQSAFISGQSIALSGGQI